MNIREEISAISLVPTTSSNLSYRRNAVHWVIEYMLEKKNVVMRIF